MFMPIVMRGSLFDNFMNDFPSVDDFFKSKGQRVDIMKTDVKETEDEYQIEMDLPGYSKDDISAVLQDGYLTVSASVNVSDEENKEDGNYIRRERYVGNCSRSFYVGDTLTQEDIGARFENGILTINIPKKVPEKIENKSYIQIEG